MNSKQEHIVKMMEMQKRLKTINNKVEEAPQEIEVVNVEVKEVEDNPALPSKYLSLNQLKLSAKEVANTTNYLDRMKQTNEDYDKIQITEEKAGKIRKELVRLTTGVSSVVPLKCKGMDCAFKNTCLTGDTDILGTKSKKLKNVEIGDIVYSFNLQNKRIEKDVVTDKKEIEDQDVYLITTWYGNKVKATANHPFLSLTKDSKKFVWKSIEDGLTKGSPILITDVEDMDDDLNSVGDAFVDKILNIKHLGKETVYDITIKKNQNFIANNIVSHNCPYIKQDAIPLGLPCPIEVQLLDYWMEKYKHEFNIQDDSITDLHAIGRLCTYDIYDMRLTRYLSEHDQTLLVDFVSSFDEHGNAISNKATSAAWDTIDKIDRMRSKQLKELMATREAKAKIIETVSQTHKTNSYNALKEKFEELIRKQDVKTVNSTAEEVK